MADEEKAISHINHKIKNGEATILTDEELVEGVQKGRDFKLSDVDVVTTSCQVASSGAAAMLCVPVAGQGVFTRAKKIWLNDVPGFPGPAPNERLGLVDTLVFADQQAIDRQGNYNGAKLIWDIIRREEIQVECLSVEGDTYESSFTLDQVEFARMYVYNSFFKKLCAQNKSASKNNHLKTIRAGSKILLNGAKGIVVGCGTRSAPGNRSLSLAADMFEMDPTNIMEFNTDSGMAITYSVALAIPVVTEEVLNELVECLVDESTQASEDHIYHLEKAVAEHLKQRISEGEFLLISSDMNLNHWF
ncbi:MAG: homocysteine biosynthesis protein [Pseudomonadota bacterium]